MNRNDRIGRGRDKSNLPGSAKGGRAANRKLDCLHSPGDMFEDSIPRSGVSRLALNFRPVGGVPIGPEDKIDLAGGRHEVLTAYGELRERTRAEGDAALPGYPRPSWRTAETGRGLPRTDGESADRAGGTLDACFRREAARNGWGRGERKSQPVQEPRHGFVDRTRFGELITDALIRLHLE